MVSKMVLDRQKYSKDLEAWANTNAHAVEQAVAAAGVEVSISAQAIVALAKNVDASLTALVAADEAHIAEQGDDAKPRADRDQASEALANKLVSLRKQVDAGYGAEGLAAVGLSERQNYDPVAVQRLAQRVIDKVSAPGFAMPAGDPDLTFNVANIPGRLAGPLATLTASLAKVDQEAAELKTTQAAKDAAMKEFDARFAAVTTVLRGFAQLGGKPEIADALPVMDRGSRGSGAGEPGAAPEAVPG
jgi:hypothetical protein